MDGKLSSGPHLGSRFISNTNTEHAGDSEQGTSPLNQQVPGGAKISTITRAYDIADNNESQQMEVGSSGEGASSSKERMLNPSEVEVRGGGPVTSKAKPYKAHVITSGNKPHIVEGGSLDEGTSSLKERMMNHSEVEVQGACKIHQLKTQDIQSSPLSFSACDSDKCKVILLVGATGAGKTTLINSLVNYVFGVEMKDKFRFELIPNDPTRSQSQSQTECVSSYTLLHQEGFKIPYTLTIIDTPGFGDTSGIARDKITIDQMRESFCSHPPIVDHIDAVGFVVNSTETKLGATQKYIFHSVLSLFGNDIADNIILLLTFSDCMQPVVLPVLKAANIPYTTERMFKFNNSAILEIHESTSGEDGEKNDGLGEIFWEFGMSNFKRFMDGLEGLPPKDLKKTNDVLKLRQDIEVYRKVLQQQVSIRIFKLIIFERELNRGGGEGQNNQTVIDDCEKAQPQKHVNYLRYFRKKYRSLRQLIFGHGRPPEDSQESRDEMLEDTDDYHNAVLASVDEIRNRTQLEVMALFFELQALITELGKVALAPDTRTIVNYIDGMIQQVEHQTESEWRQYIWESFGNSSPDFDAIVSERNQYVDHLRRFRECSQKLLDETKTGQFNVLTEILDRVSEGIDDRHLHGEEQYFNETLIVL